MFPELSELPEHLWKQLAYDSYRQQFPSLVTWNLLLCLPLLGWILFVCLWADSAAKGYFSFLVFMVGAIITLEVVTISHVRRRKRWIHKKLYNMGIRPQACLLCNYDLRGTPDESTSCPECGATISAVTASDEN